jgi:hypothetical protein
LAENYQFEQQVATKDYRNIVLPAISTVIDTETDPEIINAKISLLRKTFSSLAINGGDTFARSEMSSLDKEIQELTISSLAKFALNPQFATNSFEAINRINNGDFGDKSDFYNSLPIQEQTKIRLAVRDSYNDEIAAKNKQEETIKKESEVVFKTKLVGENPTNIYDVAFKNDVITLAQWKEAKSPEKLPGSDPIVLAKIRNQILDSKITDANQLPTGLNAKEIAKFYELIYDTNAKKATIILRNAAKIPTGSMFATVTQSEQFAKLNNQYEDNLKKLNKDGTPLYTSKQDAADAAVKNYENSSAVVLGTSSQKSAAKKLKILAPKFNLDANYNMEELEKWAFDNFNETERGNFIDEYKRYKNSQKQTGKTFVDLDI